MFGCAPVSIVLFFAISSLVSGRAAHDKRQRGSWRVWRNRGGSPVPTPSTTLPVPQTAVLEIAADTGQPSMVQPTFTSTTGVGGESPGVNNVEVGVEGGATATLPTVDLSRSTTDGTPQQTTLSGSASSDKRGISFNEGSGDLSAFANLAWGHNWDSTPNQLPSGMEFVPTLWDDAPDRVARFDSNAAGHAYLMGFNEPDMPPPQANMPVSQAADAYRRHMTPKATSGMEIGSPSVSNGEGIHPVTRQPMGLDYLSQFLRECSDCNIGFVDVHWYNTDFSDFQRFINDTKAVAGGLPIWIGEFKCNGDQTRFLEQALPWLDNPESGVKRYSYFMVGEGILKDGNRVTDLGMTYAG